jgi:N-acetylmuramoyl-L-alanine amidase
VVLTGGRIDPLALAADRPAPLVRNVRGEQREKDATIYLQVDPPLGGFAALAENGGRTLVITLRRGAAVPAAGKAAYVRPLVEMPAVGASADSFDLIALDAGHGGFDSGVKANGIVEKDFTLQVATQLQALLERDLGLRVLLLRSGDATLSVESRAEIANRARADAFISLHCNAWFDPEARGFAVLFAAPGTSTRNTSALRTAEQGLTEFVPWNAACVPFAARSQRLAERVEAALGSALDLPRNGLHAAPLEVLQGAAMPGVVLEMGFLTSPDDVAKLSAADFASRLESGMATAIRQFKQDAKTMTASGTATGESQTPDGRPQLPAQEPPSGEGEDHD